MTQRHLDATASIAPDDELDLVLWPENVVDVAAFAGSAELDAVAAEAARLEVPISVGVTEDVAGEDDRFTNAQVIVTPDGEITDRYDKVRRVPFGEYVPLRGLLEALGAPLDQVPNDAVAGSGPASLDLPGELPVVERHESRTTDVAGTSVRRALPRRRRRTVGAWCFADHFGPTRAGEQGGMQIGPHPHIGLQTVTWLVDGHLLHRDSVGSVQPIRPGELNLMTAGEGVAHAEESQVEEGGLLHGAQLWVAMPEATRHGPPAFEHHAHLPTVGLGPVTATVLVGAVGDVRSPARSDTPLVGVELSTQGGEALVPLDRDFEHGVIVLEGSLEIEGESVSPGELTYLGTHRAELRVRADTPARALLLGGAPFDEDLLMWWNFVGRTRTDIEEAARDWKRGSRSIRSGDLSPAADPRAGAAVERLPLSRDT